MRCVLCAWRAARISVYKFLGCTMLTKPTSTKSLLNWRDMLFLLLLCALLQPFWQSFILAADTPLFTWLTAHVVHVNWTHFALDMTCACLLPLLVPHISRRLFWASVLVLSVGISALLLGLNQLVAARVTGYAGFSGVLHGLYFLFPALYVLDVLQKKKRSKNSVPLDYFFWQAALLSVGTLAKVAYDWLYHPAHSAELIAAPVVYAAHLDGLIIAIGCFLVLILAKYGNKWR